MYKNSILPRPYLFILYISFICSSFSYGNVISIGASNKTTDFLGKHFEYAATLSHIELQNAINLNYKKGKDDVYNFGISDSIFWLHTKVYFTETATRFMEFDSHGIDTIDVFILKEDQLNAHYILGSNVNFKNWPVPNHNYSFSFSGLAGDTLDIYMKISSRQQLLIPIQILDEDHYWTKNLIDNLIYGIYFGVIGVMIFYNLFLFMSIKDPNYLYYIAYIIAVGLAQASLLGYSQAYLWPNIEWLRVNGTILMGALSGILTTLFVIHFLRTSKFTPFWHKILWTIIAVDILAIVFMVFKFSRESFYIINTTAGLGSIIVLITSVIIVKKGYLPAKFFLVAYSFFLVSVIIFVMKDFSILPYNEITTNSMIYGSSFEIVLLSLALANRINVLRREKEISQAESLEALRENEKIIREQNVLLEQRVNERTLELQEANEELTVTLSNLRDTQTQLVDAEKMASLGQLTAGIAHEINNPINFVTANINPLKRDLEEVYELVKAYGDVEGAHISEDLRKVHNLKEEMDYEYLKEEISSLVQGISDGANRTSEIVRGLRSFSRLDEDAIKLASIHEGLSSTMILLRSKLSNSIEVVRDFDQDIPDIECFPGKLNQMFMNILNNAIYALTHKHYADDEKPILTLKTEKRDKFVVIHLKDNGIGMDEATKKKMFDPFFTTKDVGEGTGLGMAIVYKIIEKHRGTMNVESELGVGTEFIITLPLRQPNEFE